MFDFKRFRKKRNLTQNDMAKILGLSQVSYSRIENGVWNPSEEKTQNYIQNIKKVFPALEESDFYIPDNMAGIRQKTVIGSNYIGHLEKQRDEERTDLKQMVETLKQEVSEKNAQIKEKDLQIQRLIGIIENFRRDNQPLGLDVNR